LCALFRAPFLCFQWIAASFRKIPGVGYPECHYGTPGWGWVAGPHAKPSNTVRFLTRLISCVSRVRLSLAPPYSGHCYGLRLGPVPGAIFPIRSVLKIIGQNSLATLPPAITAI